METMFEEEPEPDITVCDMCWQDDGYHFSWCPALDDHEFDIMAENVYNQTIDEEVEMEDEW
jgi:hypothetical protein